MIIREARVEDAAGIAQVQVGSWKTTYRGIVSDAFLDAMSVETREARWQQWLGDPNTQMILFVAENESGEIVAFVSGGQSREVNDKYDSELYAIYSVQEAQQQGTGRRLTHALRDKLIVAGFHSMLVWVLADNPSRAFYEKLGGQYVREKQIRLGDDEYVEVAYGWEDLRTIK